MCKYRCGYMRIKKWPKPTPPPPVPLTAIDVEVNILGFTSEVKMKQKFQNIEDVPIEANFEFNISPENTVCGFSAIVDGKRIEGICKEKEKAKDTYDDAISSGHGAYLLEQSKETPDVFSVSVGNLPPKKEVYVEITYITELSFKENELRFSIPSVKGAEIKDSPYYRVSGSTPPVANSLKAKLKMGTNIKAIASPSHPIVFEFGDNLSEATVTLADNQSEKDFELMVKLAEPNKPSAQVQMDKDGNIAAMVSFYPDLQLKEDEQVFTEMIFVVDRSGSMAGSRINQVRDCLQIFLRSLPEGTLFNIIGFGTSFVPLFKEGSKEYNDKCLEEASKYVSTMTANMGGTNILNPLLSIFKEPSKPGIPRQIFLLTDGEVDNTTECINAVRKNAQTTRVFTFGIGSGASKELVTGIAKAGEGDFEIIVEGQPMDDKVMRQLKRAIQPALTDLKVSWGKLNATMAPNRLPPLFCGSRLIVYGFIPAKGAESDEVVIEAQTAIKPFRASIKVEISGGITKGNLVHKLAAKALIKDFEVDRSAFHDDNGKLLPKYNKKDVDSEIIRLSTTYGVLSPLTAFVAVEKRDEATDQQMQLRNISVAKPKNIPEPQRASVASSSSLGFSFGSNKMKKKKSVSKDKEDSKDKKLKSDSKSKPMQQAKARVSIKEEKGKKMEKKKEEEEEKSRSRKARTHFESAQAFNEDEAENSGSASSDEDSAITPMEIEEEKKAPKIEEAKPVSAEMREIIMSQKASGSWPLRALGKLTVDAIKNAVPKIPNGSQDEILALWATAVVIVYLTIKFPDQKINWDLVVDKARKWIKKEEKRLNFANPFDWEGEANKLVNSA